MFVESYCKIWIFLLHVASTGTKKSPFSFTRLGITDIYRETFVVPVEATWSEKMPILQLLWTNTPLRMGEHETELKNNQK